MERYTAAGRAITGKKHVHLCSSVCICGRADRFGRKNVESSMIYVSTAVFGVPIKDILISLAIFEAVFFLIVVAAFLIWHNTPQGGHKRPGK